MSAASQFFGGGGGGGSQLVEVFAVGGGGPGGPQSYTSAPSSYYGGGGGSGQVVYTTTSVTPGKSYTITVGGAGSPTIFNDVQAFGGGGGSAAAGPSPYGSIYEGSAGGGGFPATGANSTIFARTTPTVSDLDRFKLNSNGSTGGPGAGGAGGNVSLPGYKIGIPGTVFGAGGAGGSFGSGGSNGSPGTGNGGQGGSYGVPYGAIPAGSGGSGTIIIRFPTAFDAATVTGDTPVTPQPGYHVYRWVSGPGSITFN